MDATNIDLPGCQVQSVSQDGDTIRVRFEPAYLIKTMTGSQERTRWWQNGELVFEGAELMGELPALPGECTGGDVGENVYTYRDMVPLPLVSRGHAHCDLMIAGTEQRIQVRAEAVELRMEEVAKYVKHIRPGDPDYK